MNMKKAPIILTLLFAFSLPGATSAKSWAYLGEAHVDGNADHDKIKVGHKEGLFRALQLRVDRGAIAFRHVVVHYSNGTNEQVQVRQRINGGGATRVIDLRGNERSIENVEIWYERANYGSNRPRVRLYGR
jgi:hypothetical protein